MPLINFEVIKLRKNFQLDIFYGSTFFQISEIIFTKFNVDTKDFSDAKSFQPIFIYKSVTCRYDRTIDSYQIGDQSKVFIFFPKEVFGIISKAFKTSSRLNLQNQKNLPKSSNGNNSTQNISSLPSNSTASNTAIAKIMNYVDQNQLIQLASLGYSKVDAAYALAFKKNVQQSIEFIDIGLASDPVVRGYIEKVVEFSLINDTDNVIRNLIEINVIECRKKKQNEEIGKAVAIGLICTKYKIKDPNYKKELVDYITKVNEKYPNETEELFQNKMNELIQNQKQNQLQTQIQILPQNQTQIYPQVQNLPQQPNIGEIYAQQLTQIYGQSTGQAYSQIYQNCLAIETAKQKFWNFFKLLPQMSPQNYKNPFEETINDLSNVQHAPQDDFFYTYGRQLNYEQLMFLYRVTVQQPKVDLPDAMQILNASNGNIKDAEILVNNS